jgi:hypothetical protein
MFLLERGTVDGKVVEADHHGAGCSRHLTWRRARKCNLLGPRQWALGRFLLFITIVPLQDEEGRACIDTLDVHSSEEPSSIPESFGCTVTGLHLSQHALHVAIAVLPLQLE